MGLVTSSKFQFRNTEFKQRCALDGRPLLLVLPKKVSVRGEWTMSSPYPPTVQCWCPSQVERLQAVKPFPVGSKNALGTAVTIIIKLLRLCSLSRFFAAASVYSALLYDVAPIFSCFSHTFITQATGIKPFFILGSRETSKRVFESELMTVGGALEEAAPLMRRTKLCPEPQNSFDSGKTSFHEKSQQRKI